MRTEALLIRLTIDERLVIRELARRKRLPVSTFVRSFLLQEADRHNISADAVEGAGSDQRYREAQNFARRQGNGEAEQVDNGKEDGSDGG